MTEQQADERSGTANEVTAPTLVFLHALGMSGREWQEVGRMLPGPNLALDLPGFGANQDVVALDVGAMADWLIGEISKRGLTNIVLVGHSMGGKIATVVAARTANDRTGLRTVSGVILIAASPPAPEPMEEARRSKMLSWAASGPISRDDAASFVDANTAARLPDHFRETAIDDVMRTAPQAWRAWLKHGSREDWRATVGRIVTPALIIAGAEDGDLGVDAQRRLNLPHYENARVEVMQNAAHLIPYERPDALASLIKAYVSNAVTSPS